MEQTGYINSTPDLNAIFAALADPTRREILSRLSHGPADVSELTEPFEISQPAISKHLKVLERAGLIARDIDAQRRPARLRAQNMAAAMDWLAVFEAFWEPRFNGLNNVLQAMNNNDDDTGD